MDELSIFITEIRSLIGTPPAGFEWLEYLIVAIILLWLLNACVSFVSGLFKWIGSGFQ